jgi:hypothetical protein
MLLNKKDIFGWQFSFKTLNQDGETNGSQDDDSKNTF